MADCWDCLICGRPIGDAVGVSLDGSAELHVCKLCWAAMTPASRLAECRAWRESTERIAAMRAYEQLARQAMSSSALNFLGRGGGEGRN